KEDLKSRRRFWPDPFSRRPRRFDPRRVARLESPDEGAGCSEQRDHEECGQIRYRVEGFCRMQWLRALQWRQELADRLLQGGKAARAGRTKPLEQGVIKTQLTGRSSGLGDNILGQGDQAFEDTGGQQLRLRHHRHYRVDVEAGRTYTEFVCSCRS